MNTYWLSRSGGSAAEGPFAESQLHSMLQAGTLTLAARVCMEGDEEWLPVQTLFEAVEEEKRERDRRNRRAAQADLLRRQYESEKKSAGIAVAMSALLPFGGQIYAKAYGHAVTGFLLGLVLAVLLPPALWVLWGGSMIDAANATKQYNRRLADGIGVIG